MATNKTTRMDAQGRVILPPHIRKELNLNSGQLLTVSLEGGAIKIQPAEQRCILCGEATVEKHIIGPHTKLVCKNCATSISNTVQRRGWA